MATLGDYVTEAESLLRDNSNKVYSSTDLNRWANEGIAQRDVALGLNRMTYGFNLLPGIYAYTFEQILSDGTLLLGDPNTTPVDVLSIVIVPLGFATSQPRYPVGRWAYSQVAPLLATSYPTYPAKYAMYGPRTIVLGPPPASRYPTEIDMFGYSPPLPASGSVDPIPFPWTTPVPYYICYKAKLQSQRFDEARQYFNDDPRAPGLYQTSIATCRARGRPISVPNPTLPSR